MQGYKINRLDGKKIVIRPIGEWQRRPFNLRFADHEVHVYGFTIPYIHGHLIHDIVSNYENIDQEHELAFFNAVSYLLALADHHVLIMPSEQPIPKPEYHFLSQGEVQLVWDREDHRLDLRFHEQVDDQFFGDSSDGVIFRGPLTRSEDLYSAILRWLQEGY